MIERILVNNVKDSSVYQEYCFTEFTCIVGSDREERKQFIDLILHLLFFKLQKQIYPLKTQRYVKTWLNDFVSKDFYLSFSQSNEFERCYINNFPVYEMVTEGCNSNDLYVIENIECGLTPCEQRDVVQKLKENYPYSQFIVTTNSPIIVQNLEVGELIDLDRKDLKVLPEGCEKFSSCFPWGKTERYGKSVSEILKNIFEFEE